MTTNPEIPEPESEASKFIRAAKYADFGVMPALLFESIGMSDGPPAAYPAWVRRCGEKVNRAVFPRVFSTAKKLPAERAYAAGLAFGLMVTGQKVAARVVPDGLPEPTQEQLLAVWKWLYSDPAETHTPSDEGDLISTEIRAELKVLEANFTAEEQADFDQGKADAGKMILGDNDATETTQIYRVMLTFWKVVDRLPTSQFLFEILTGALGQNVVGSDPKRVQQLCRRIGKTFGKPGRPRKLLQRKKSAK